MQQIFKTFPMFAWADILKIVRHLPVKFLIIQQVIKLIIELYVLLICGHPFSLWVQDDTKVESREGE